MSKYSDCKHLASSGPDLDLPYCEIDLLEIDAEIVKACNCINKYMGYYKTPKKSQKDIISRYLSLDFLMPIMLALGVKRIDWSELRMGYTVSILTVSGKEEYCYGNKIEEALCLLTARLIKELK